MATERDSRFPEEGPVEATRRRFLKWLLGILALVNGLIAGIPFLRSLLGSPAAAESSRWVKVSAVDLLPLGKPISIRFVAESEDAYIRKTELHSAWVVRDSTGQITVFSPVCTHLGCYYVWNGEAERFECPCHASVFALDGKVMGGPAPRPLDTLPSKIENGSLMVEWENFKPGVLTKIIVA